MGWPFSTKEDDNNADYKEGYDEGRSANLSDRIVHELGNMAEGAIIGSEPNDVAEKGYQEGLRDNDEHGKKG